MAPIVPPPPPSVPPFCMHTEHASVRAVNEPEFSFHSRLHSESAANQLADVDARKPLDTSLSHVDSPALEQVQVFYSLQDYDQIMLLLERSPHLIPLLLAIPQKVTEAFGHRCTLVMRLDTSSGTDDELVVEVPTSMDVDDALEALQRFDENWWLDQLPQARGMLTVTVDFR